MGEISTCVRCAAHAVRDRPVEHRDLVADRPAIRIVAQLGKPLTKSAVLDALATQRASSKAVLRPETPLSTQRGR